MEISLVTEGIGHLTFEKACEAAAGLGIAGMEVGAGNWCSGVHLGLGEMLKSPEKRKKFLSVLKANGLKLSALNCSGNQLHPVTGKDQSRTVNETMDLAEMLECDTVVMMSGLPGGSPGDVTANWITCAWPPETGKVLKYQWDEVAIPYWTGQVAYAKKRGIKKICIEMHGHQLVYNPPTLMKLRNAVGNLVGANFDPSHLLWMGADPLLSIDYLGEAIHHVHAKDTFIDPRNCALNGRLETLGHDKVKERAWSYITLGYGQDDIWWKEFCFRLRRAGYDGWLSIEHEDMLLSRMEGLRKSIDLLNGTMIKEKSDYVLPDV